MNKYHVILSGLLVFVGNIRAMEPALAHAAAQEQFRSLVKTRNTIDLVKFFKFGPVARLGLYDFLFLETALQKASEWPGPWKEREALIRILGARIELEKIILATVYN